MSVIDTLRETIARLMKNTEEQTSVREAFRVTIEGLKAQVADIQSRLDAALNAEDEPDQDALQEISDELTIIADALDADVIADKALLNTPHADEAVGDGTSPAAEEGSGDDTD